MVRVNKKQSQISLRSTAQKSRTKIAGMHCPGKALHALTMHACDFPIFYHATTGRAAHAHTPQVCIEINLLLTERCGTGFL
jgi:hypothetical protein